MITLLLVCQSRTVEYEAVAGFTSVYGISKLAGQLFGVGIKFRIDCPARNTSSSHISR